MASGLKKNQLRSNMERRYGIHGRFGRYLDKAEAERFVGREHEIESFRQHISSTPPTYIFFYITGQGGVGKTALLATWIIRSEN
jgi:DNA-binding NtrC family response regulator